PTGAIRPNHAVTSKPGKPDSAMVGRPGAAGERVREVTASGRNLPSRTRGRATGVLANAMGMRPASRSGTACRYAAVWNVPDIDQSHGLEQHAGSVIRSPDPAGGKCEFARLRTSKQDEFLHVLHRQVDMCNSNVRCEA